MASTNENLNNIKKMWDNEPFYAETFEYEMSSELARALLASENKKIPDPQKYLVDFVNRECFLKGHCTAVVVR